MATHWQLVLSSRLSLELSWQHCRIASSDPCHAHWRPLSSGDPERTCSAVLPACIKQIQSNNFGSCIIKMPRTTGNVFEEGSGGGRSRNGRIRGMRQISLKLELKGIQWQWEWE